MLRHIFICPAMPDCTDEQLTYVVSTLRQLPDLVPEIKGLSVEKTLDLSQEGKGVVLIAEFESQHDWERYMHNEKHLALGDVIKPHIDLSRMVVTQTAVDTIRR